jgi:hypothetical protein
LEIYDDKWDTRCDRPNAWIPADYFIEDSEFLAVAGSCKSTWRYALEADLLCCWANLLRR